MANSTKSTPSGAWRAAARSCRGGRGVPDEAVDVQAPLLQFPAFATGASDDKHHATLIVGEHVNHFKAHAATRQGCHFLPEKEDLFGALVLASQQVVTGNVPSGIGRKQLGQRSPVTPGHGSIAVAQFFLYGVHVLSSWFTSRQ